MSIDIKNDLILISAYGGTGKDSVADYLVENYSFTKLAFADALRAVAAAINPIVSHHTEYVTDEYGNILSADVEYIRYLDALESVGYNQAKFDYPEVRSFLQLVGTDAVRNNLGDNIWVDTAMKRADQLERVVIPDCRFVNEAQAGRSRGGFVIRMNRPGVGPAGSHISEVGLDDYSFDTVIENDGSLEDLFKKVDEWLDINMHWIRNS